ncbi:MAG TPA: SgcJ/EcaC family oxidoreductase [Thermoanaerobaculia bacterium]|jgi:uncharacterized protein (TIGR02246 family)|nr:SgcJ/EcaC family oxidoreductase [Thermoanaerobaculia bacterium]
MTREELERENRAIDQTFADWMEAGRKGDAETLVSLITEDAEFWTHGAPAMKGREAAAAMFQGFFAGYTYEQSFETLERIVTGGWAFVRGTEHNRVTPRGGETVEIRQRAFMVLRREPDGRWRYARGMTNLETRPPVATL